MCVASTDVVCVPKRKNPEPKVVIAPPSTVAPILDSVYCTCGVVLSWSSNSGFKLRPRLCSNPLSYARYPNSMLSEKAV